MIMKKVFICSPYRGDVERNVALAKAHARFAAHCGYCPVAPHLMYPQFLKDSDPDERILGITLVRLYSDDGSRIYPETMMIDDRITDAFRQAVYKLRFA